MRSDPRRVAAAYGSERLFTIDGTPPAVWAALSGFFPTVDGWLRTHANYPHHAKRLTGALGLPDDATREQLGDALARTRATEAVRRILAAGGVAAEARPADPAEDRRRTSAGILARQSFAGPRRPWMDGELPLAGIRVLDLTRVIAGPVATRTLALFGADVLRVDSPRLARDRLAAPRRRSGQALHPARPGGQPRPRPFRCAPRRRGCHRARLSTIGAGTAGTLSR